MATIVLYMSFFLTIVVWMSIVEEKVVCQKLTINNDSSKSLVYLYYIGLMPLVCIFALRYGIGADFFAYSDMYDLLHNTSFNQYYKYHLSGTGDYYVELGYYILNRVAPSYTSLQFLIAFLISFNIIIAIKNFSYKQWLGVYIFLCCNFVYSMNATRYILGLSIILIGYSYFVRKKYWKYLIFVLLASLFHKTFLICLFFIVLKDYRKGWINKLVLRLEIAVVLISPILIPVLLDLASKLSIFSRYFNTPLYTYSMSSGISLKWLIHIIPVAIVFLLIRRDTMKNDATFMAMFRIYLMEIPFRYMAFYNVWYGRLARIPQVVEVILIPYAISKLYNKNNKNLIVFYYIVWYMFYFIYFWALDADNYRSILF